MDDQVRRQSLLAEARENFARHLARNPYPGRGLVLGSAVGGGWLQVYWIMGRSENSRNRVFVSDGGELRTEAADPAKVADRRTPHGHFQRFLNLRANKGSSATSRYDNNTVKGISK